MNEYFSSFERRMEILSLLLNMQPSEKHLSSKFGRIGEQDA